MVLIVVSVVVRDVMLDWVVIVVVVQVVLVLVVEVVFL